MKSESKTPGMTPAAEQGSYGVRIWGAGVKAMCQALGIWLVVGMTACGRAPESTVAGSLEPLPGWYRLAGRNESREAVSGHDTLIPVFQRDGVWYSACRGMEIPFQKGPEGLEWAVAPSSMTGTKIGYDAGTQSHYLVIEDRQLEQNWDGYVRGEKRPLTRTAAPSAGRETTAPRPQANADFAGWYAPTWFPWIRLQIREEGDQFVSQEYDFASSAGGGWREFGTPHSLTALPDQPGFALGPALQQRLIYNEALQRFELIRTDAKSTPAVLRMPLTRLTTATAIPDQTPPPTTAIGIPSWH